MDFATEGITDYLARYRSKRDIQITTDTGERVTVQIGALSAPICPPDNHKWVRDNLGSTYRDLCTECSAVRLDASKPLNDLEFDTVFQITESGDVIERHDLHAPGYCDRELDSALWETWSDGYSGQYSYSGPVMHSSEYLGGSLERDLRSTPGIYAVILAYYEMKCEECGGEECDHETEIEPDGWLIVRYTGEAG